ncbi:threonine ammonia-lyase [Fictibacillus nanhaiensis]|uniref:threonine ammonia-lyase n=1 Tax=Fictibacillus nanhaiensis TaxID=742169 RepID=UPI001C96D41A|nr:threonine ammonia-lyase [Fictibacillus nanhaiensis]MBY6035290.1 threonine ammonia-lyase [Fictibacillus nanhaiensis]
MEEVSKIAHRTPLKQSTTLNKWTGGKVYMKLENMQKTGSFKLRGAYYKISTLNEIECARGVIAASAGNHAQGLALSCSLRGIKSKIFMPENAPLSKIEAVKSYGANIVLEGDNYQAAYEAAKREKAMNEGVFVHPFDDYDVIAGQSTVALEMLQQNPELKTIVVPVGGGGLLAGIALAVKSVRPDVRVVGVQSVNASAVFQAFTGTSKKSLSRCSSIADGIAVVKPGEITVPLISKYVDEMVTVTEEQIAYAMMFMLEREKVVVEGAGAASLAAVLFYSHLVLDQKTGIIVSGGNVDPVKWSLYKGMADKLNLKRIS